MYHLIVTVGTIVYSCLFVTCGVGVPRITCGTVPRQLVLMHTISTVGYTVYLYWGKLSIREVLVALSTVEGVVLYAVFAPEVRVSTCPYHIRGSVVGVVIL